MKHSRLSALLFYGALWGALEATLGYGLHLLRRVVAVPGLPGFILFPIGLLIMIVAMRVTGLRWAPFAVAVVAAGTKAASAALPAVAPIFVINPTLAILAEGAVVTAGVMVFSFASVRRVFGETLAVALGWRLLFLGLLVVLPVRAGILQKGTTALVQFVVLESVVNAGLAFVAVWASARSREGGSLRRIFQSITAVGRTAPAFPMAAPIALFAAVGLQMAAAVL